MTPDPSSPERQTDLPSKAAPWRIRQEIWWMIALLLGAILILLMVPSGYTENALSSNEHLLLARRTSPRKLPKKAVEPSERERPLSPKVRWQVRLDDHVTAAPAVDNAMVYVASSQGNVYALNREDGSLRWQKTLGEPLMKSSPVMVGNRLFIGTATGKLIALDKELGRVLWQVPADGPIVSAPAADAENVYFATRRGNLYALRVTDGTLTWRYETGQIIDAAPLLSKQTLFIGDYEGHIYAFSPPTGEKQWESRIEGPLVSRAIADDRLVYFSSAVGAMFAVERETGKRQWSYTSPTGDPMVGTPAVLSPKVCVGDTNGVVGCVDNEFGLKLWQKPVEGAVLSAIHADQGRLVLGTGSGILLALDADSGESLWSLPLEGVLDADAVIDEGALFLGTKNGNVFALEFPESSPQSSLGGASP